MVVVAVIAAVIAVAAIVALGVTRGALRDARRHGDELSADLTAAHGELSSARDELSSTRTELAASRADVDVRDALLQSLWGLELLRVVREWAVTGGDVPGDDASVAAHTGAELVMALRMELDRQREESGIPGELAPSTAVGALPVSTALAALRLVEEVMAVVSRPSEGLTVRAVVDGDELVVTMQLDEAEPDVPAIVRGLATGAGASVAVDGTSVTLRLPA